jgi:hypothetical protein
MDTNDSVRILRSYLDLYLPVGDRQYDQTWAIGALQWLDRKHGVENAKVYLENSALWQATSMNTESTVLDPEEGIIHFQKVMEFTDRYFPEFANNPQ